MKIFQRKWKLVSRWVHAKIPFKIFNVRLLFTLLKSTRDIAVYSKKFVHVKNQCVVISDLIQPVLTLPLFCDDVKELLVLPENMHQIAPISKKIFEFVDGLQTFLNTQMSQLIEALEEVKQNKLPLASEAAPEVKVDANAFKLAMKHLFIRGANANVEPQTVPTSIQPSKPVKEAYVWLIQHDKVVAHCLKNPSVHQLYRSFYSNKICSCFMSYDTLKINQPPMIKGNIVAYFYVLLCDSQQDKHVQELPSNKNGMAFLQSMKQHPLKRLNEFKGVMALFKCVCEFNPNKKEEVGMQNIQRFVDVESSMTQLVASGMHYFFTRAAVKRIQKNIMIGGAF